MKRQQQYLGAAAGAVEEMRAEELLRAKERKIKATQVVHRAEAELAKEARTQAP